MNIPKTPAQLWLGDIPTLIKQVTIYLQQLFCLHNGCFSCIICKQIAQRQYHAVRWLIPEKSHYTIEQSSQILKELSFMVEKECRFFFIIEQADLLSNSCANSLLKSFEEPPAGYHFILLAQRKNLIAPTLLSRCIIYSYEPYNTALPAIFFTIVNKKSSITPSQFIKELEKLSITEYDARNILDQLLAHWLGEEKKAITSNDSGKTELAASVINLIIKSYKQLPMPGSTKLFWRNFYIQLQSLI